MSQKIQLDLFVEESEISLLRKEIKELSLQQERFKRALYSRHNDLSRFYLKLKEENEELRRRLNILESSNYQKDESSNDDLLEKLFREAYFSSNGS